MALLAPLLFTASLIVLATGVAGFLFDGRREQEKDLRGRATSTSPEETSGIESLLVRAGRNGDLTARSVTAVRFVGATVLPLVALPASGVLPGRFGYLVLAGLAGLGFLAPNLILERMARKRLGRIVSGLPDALDLLAVQLGAGRSMGSAMRELARSGHGPLATEFGVAADEIERGVPQTAAMQGLRLRTGGTEMAAFCATVERSRRLGSPLAVELERQASATRIESGRAVAERAARAAPKIQLVIALVLVPAVMLLVVAALVANSDRLIGFAFG